MIYICSEPPQYCPQCGHNAGNLWRDKWNRQDFFAGAAHHCASGCGTRFQYIEEEKILKLAQKNGDMT